eukprot:CAMPEP_0183754590 /NCGR_PEP_ID=MMETSP0739-20130205/3617_1 /TAXON_ID=385413 /ORGANISM="Thalassiosira miniscula, Strain CCMP1093" /LENGTH=49 /DNA_ID=CAMNT_0025991219 /DNA_START=393 /DNA_END=542 /DNA_ORIENTATION=+
MTVLKRRSFSSDDGAKGEVYLLLVEFMGSGRGRGREGGSYQALIAMVRM